MQVEGTDGQVGNQLQRPGEFQRLTHARLSDGWFLEMVYFLDAGQDRLRPVAAAHVLQFGPEGACHRAGAVVRAEARDVVVPVPNPSVERAMHLFQRLLSLGIEVRGSGRIHGLVLMQNDPWPSRRGFTHPEVAEEGEGP